MREAFASRDNTRNPDAIPSVIRLAASRGGACYELISIFKSLFCGTEEKGAPGIDRSRCFALREARFPRTCAWLELLFANRPRRSMRQAVRLQKFHLGALFVLTSHPTAIGRVYVNQNNISLDWFDSRGDTPRIATECGCGAVCSSDGGFCPRHRAEIISSRTEIIECLLSLFTCGVAARASVLLFLE